MKVYEEKVLEIMNLSKTVFPGNYEFVPNQSHGECDIVDKDTDAKFDAKLPFTENQIKLLTTGERHKPKIKEWIELLCKESTELDLNKLKERCFDFDRTKLYPIMKAQVEKDKKNENIVFFFPFPIVPDERNGIHLHFALDYLRAIDQKLHKELDMKNRKIYSIYPTLERNWFSLRCLSSYKREYIKYEGLNGDFLFEVSNLQLL